MNLYKGKKVNIAIYCGSTFGNSDIYKNEAIKVAKTFAKYNFNMVYGGSLAGTMGIISNEALKNSVKVYGVITYDLEHKEIANKNITKLYKVPSMRSRKKKMEELSDAFIAMPGGFGTLEEIFEVLTNAQIGYHKKPIAFYNVDGYYNQLFEFLDSCVQNGFIQKPHLDMIILSDDIEEIFLKIKEYQAPKGKWEL